MSKDRELKAVAEAIEDKYSVSASMNDVAQAAISASDSQYVRGLVEALKKISDIVYHKKESVLHDTRYEKIYWIAQNSIDALPEDLR